MRGNNEIPHSLTLSGAPHFLGSETQPVPLLNGKNLHLSCPSGSVREAQAVKAQATLPLSHLGRDLSPGFQREYYIHQY